MPERPVKRSARVSERVREEIARQLARDLSDPRLLHAMVTEVTMPDDLQSATVKVRLAAGGGDAANRKRLLDGLRAASGLIRKGMSRTLGLRRSPEATSLRCRGSANECHPDHRRQHQRLAPWS